MSIARTEHAAPPLPKVDPAPRRRRVNADLAAIVVIAACALILHRDGLLGGPAFVERDTQLFYYPLAHWLGDQLHRGNYPLWLPGIFTGYPIYADGELGMLYLPQVLLLASLPTAIALVWLRVLHAFLAGLLMHLLLRTWRLEPVPALGGALVFAFGSFLVAQMHHENVVRSAVWLPAVLACADQASRASRGKSVIGWSALGALAFSQSAVGLHVQPVLMLALAVAGYALVRVAARRSHWRLTLASTAAIGVGGLVIAAAQWLPLGEWALVSSRRGGVDYEFGSAFGLAPENLPTVIFPFFFRLPDAATWWTLWQQWETELYVGIPTLALMLIGVVFARRAEIIYLVGLGVVSLWIGMAHYAPVFNLHLVLWSLPGFSFLRAPGRFTYLVVFACAGLAAFGLQALRIRRARLLVALVGGAPSVALLAALLALLPLWRTWLLADAQRARAFVEATYLATRSQYPMDPGLVAGGLEASLDLANPKTAWSLALLALTTLAFVVWLGFRQRVVLGQSVFVGLLAIDLLVFAADFHPRTPLENLMPVLPAGVGPGARVLLDDPTDLPAFEPDQLLAADIASTDGYSSLPSQRHVEVEADTAMQPNLFDLWSAGLILEPLAPTDARQVDGVPFRLKHPLAAGFGGALPTTFRIAAATDAVAAMRIIGTLSYAFQAPQGTQVATLEVVGDQGSVVLPIRAGVELAERAYDRPSLAGLVQHQRARVALDFEEATPEGEDYTAHVYEADLPLPGAMRVRSLVLTATDPTVLVEVHGLGLVSAGAPGRGSAAPSAGDGSATARPASPPGGVVSLGLGDREGLRAVGPGVLADTTALPRAFVVPRDQAFSPARHPGLTATQLVASPDMDVHRQVLIEGDPSVPPAPRLDSVPIRPAETVEDLGPDRVRITAGADVPSYLVLDDFYHRGWTAHVDGQTVRVLLGNALFRAVALEPGEHVIEFRFAPVSHLVGAAISAVALLVDLALLAWARRGRRSR